MAEDFTFESPDSKNYLKAVIALLRSKKETKIADLLVGCKCDISSGGQFSRRRWNAIYTTVNLYVPIAKLDAFTEYERKIILDACDSVMPKNAGYDVMELEISPSLDEISNEPTLSVDLEKISSELTENFAEILPNDILKKGKEMAEVYLYLYCIENSLRLFIESVAKQNFGDEWVTKLSMNRSIRDSIKLRMEQEEHNQWLSLRGKSELFFVDFKDLGSIIASNWDIFKQHFPNLKWIESRIEELAQCRNLVAHNSYIGDHEKDMLRLYYCGILKQIGLIQ
ncbi:MAG: Swt1 family HEPN domain-containing protein [Methanoregula sp.]|jgi:hypothetical protein